MLGVERIQSSRYLSFLENTMMLFQIPKFSYQIRESLRSQQKVHVIDQGFGRVYSSPRGAVLESIIARHVWEKFPKNTFFWRDKEEVDLVIKQNDSLLPIEVKISENVAKADLAGLLAFCRKFDVAEGVVVYGGQEKVEMIDGVNIKFFSHWKYLLEL